MPDYQLTVRYKFGINGWEEVFYTNAVTAGGAAILPVAFRNASIACRAPGVNLQSSSASNVLIPHDTALIKYNQVAPGVVGASPDVTNTAVRLNLQSLNGKSRKLWLRGLNDDWTIRDLAGNMNLAPALTSYIDDYIDKMTTTNLLIQILDNITVNPWADAGTVEKHTLGGQDWAQINAATTFSMLPGTDVYLSRFPQTSLGGLKGIFRVLFNGGTFIVVNYRWQLGNAIVNTNNARVKKVTYQYEQIADGQIDDLSTHKTGTPSDRPRGRRSGLIVRR